jgi:hypothetical protein
MCNNTKSILKIKWFCTVIFFGADYGKTFIGNEDEARNYV